MKRQCWIWLLIVLVGLAAVSAVPYARPAQAEENANRGPAKLFIVGTGPGAADLIALRAVDCMKQADVLFAGKETVQKFASYLEGKEIVSPPMFRYWEILEKKCWQAAPENQSVCAKRLAQRKDLATLIRSYLQKGKRVVLLEGGDPCIFGALRWVKQEFADEEFEVIPGVSAFNAANALLKREVVDSYVADRQTRTVVLTTPLRQGDRFDSIEEFAKTNATLVFFMPETFEESVLPVLLRHYSSKTPVAVVYKASIGGEEKILRGTLQDFPSQPASAESFYRLIYVGEFLRDARGLY